MTRKKLRISAALLCVLFAASCIAAVFVNLYNSHHSLEVTRYFVSSSKISEEINIAVISDLHCNELGKNNSHLFEKTKELNPDLILVIGDMVDDDTEDISFLEDFYSSLSSIAPTYCSLGNHEENNPNAEEIKEIIESNTQGLLDMEYRDIYIKGNELRLSGIGNTSYFQFSFDEFMRNFSLTDRFTLLLSHHPEYYLWNFHKLPIDLTLSGHTHGGQVILPFSGGLYAPEQGYSPEYDYGQYEFENGTLIISRGLGTSQEPIPRFNNPPELLHITLTPENTDE